VANGHKITLENPLMLKRKIYDYLLAWRKKEKRKPLLISGCRQVGKTFIVRYFGEQNYNSVIYLDFMKHPEYGQIFKGSLDVDTLMLSITALIPGSKAIPNKTLLIFDEIQECPEARSSLKYFYADGRFDLIGTGSFLGVNGYIKGTIPSVPVGSEEKLTLYPLDFEEFLWANGIRHETIALLADSLDQQKPIPLAIHERIMELFRQYLCVGGFPEGVVTFIETHDMNAVRKYEISLSESLSDDFGRHKKEDGTTYFSASEVARIRANFDSLPRQLAKEYKKFQYSMVKCSCKNPEKRDALEFLFDSGLAVPCHNLLIPELPLDGNSIDNEFKVYMADIGLLVSRFENGTASDILNGNLGIYKGAIYENLVADALSKMGRKLYYFHKESGLEIDFVIRYKGESVLLEAKSETGNAKSLKAVLASYERYHVRKAIKLGNYNIGFENSVLTMPYYLVFLLRENDDR
jgi:predicted AAA+ superfamily ATPase